jgi:hypothetical protein
VKIEEIESLWSEDSIITDIDLSREASKIPQLHAKYYQIYIREKMILLKYRNEYKKLKLEKHEFLINPTEDKFNDGWKLPAQGKILKNEIHTYLDGDDLLLQQELKIGIQEEKVTFLKSIIDSINTRNFIIKNMIEDRRFMAGG